MSPFRAGSRRHGPSDEPGQEPLWMALDDAEAPRTPVPSEQVGAIAAARDAGLEAILGPTTDFLPVSFLELGRRRAQAVARIVVRQPSPEGLLVAGRGTGFLVGPDVLMTNHHVLPDTAKAGASTVEFRYELDVLGNEVDADVWELRPDDLFVTSPFEQLDTTLVRVAPKDGKNAGEVYGQVALRADPRKVAVDEPVCLIQHPEGRRKEVVLFESKVKELYQEGFLHYSSDTLEGSSGSPVFNVTWDLVALHHRGVIERNEAGDYQVKDGQYVYVTNEGVRISAIVEFLRGLPEPQQSALSPLLVP